MAGPQINLEEELRLLKRIDELHRKLKNTSPDSEEYEKISVELKNAKREYNQLPKYQEDILLESLELNAKNINIENKRRNIFLKLLDNRYGFALWMCIVACLISLFLGVMIYVIVQSDFLDLVIDMFLMWCAPAVVAALLLLLTPISEDLSLGFGYGLYYGMFAVHNFVTIFTNSITFSYMVSFIITALICYIVYLKITQ